MKKDSRNERDDAVSFVRSFRFALAVLCCFVTMNVYAQRVAMSMAVVCMVNHTAVKMMRLDAPLYSSSSSLTTATPGEWQRNESDDAIEQLQSPCDNNGNNFVAGGNRSRTMDGPFAWPKAVQGHVLGSFFVGYTVSQIPSALMAQRLGAKWVLFAYLGASTLATLLTPAAATLGYAAVIAARIVCGIGSGALFPGITAIWSQWAPPMERSRLAMVSFTGTMIGEVLAMSLSGFLCKHGFDDGWSSIFYTYGASSAVALIMWAVIASNSPATNRFISNKEKLYILKRLAGESSKQSLSLSEMPWRRIMTSWPVWAIVVASLCMDWGGFTLMTSIPTFYREVLVFDVQSNGLFSALPSLGVWTGSLTSSFVADHLRSRKFLSTTVTRKLFTFVGMLGSALLLVGVSFLGCSQKQLAVALMPLSTTFIGLALSGFFVNHMDIAPPYAGTLMGVSNGISAAAGFFAPPLAAVLTVAQTRESWQVVFFITAGVFTLGGVVYCVLGSGVIQPWAVEHRALTVDVALGPTDDQTPSA